MHLELGKIDKQGTPDEVFLNGLPSGKFRQSGTILEASKNGLVYIVNVLVGNEIVQITASEEEVKNLQSGDSVIVASKAWNPMFVKIDS